MVRRLVVVALVAATLGVGSAHAGCEGASVGHRGGATVDLNEVGGDRTITVELDARYVDVCDDGSVLVGEGVILGAPTTLTISGDQACTREIGSDWDPFGFAVGVHEVDENGDPISTECHIDITWSGFLSVYTPDLERSGGDTSGGQLVLSKPTNHENSLAWVDGVAYERTAAEAGVMWTGVGGNV